MASFTRADYEAVFAFAHDRWCAAHRRGQHRSAENAARIMDMCETVLGQQSERPEASRAKAQVLSTLTKLRLVQK